MGHPDPGTGRRTVIRGVELITGWKKERLFPGTEDSDSALLAF